MPEQQQAPSIPAQHQDHQPGKQSEMHPRPKAEMENYVGSGKLKGRIALITGGDSGIGRAAAIAFAKEGANLVIVYYDEHDDARDTQRRIEATGRECVLLAGDVADPAFCRKAIDTAISSFGKLDVLVNNAAQQYPQQSITDISDAQLEKTFRTNIFSMFYMVRAAMPHLKPGARIINTASITAYRGSGHLLDYSATKGAIVAFTRSLSQQLAPQQILVNAVAPGPIWTPLIPSSFPAEKVEGFGEKEPLGRVGQPDDVAPSFVFLASQDAAYMTGQVLHPNGGEIING